MSVREGASATTHWLNMVSYRDMRPSCPAAAQALQQQRKRQYNKETMQLDPKPVVNQARRVIHEMRADIVWASDLRRQHIRPYQDHMSHSFELQERGPEHALAQKRLTKEALDAKELG